VAVHKFTSCDGCQLAFLNLGEGLLELTRRVDLVHFAEAGPVAPDAAVDVAFVEGSISTPDEAERIERVRANSKYLVAIGACATSGGLQALRNGRDLAEWVAAIYASPEHINALATATPLSEHVHVDLELWGCPVTGRQVLAAVSSLLFGVRPAPERDSVCMECKRDGRPCVVVSKGEPCMGPVTRTGCGALCPGIERGCYGCFGPAEAANTESLGRRFQALGLGNEQIARRFLQINSQAPAFAAAGARFGGLRPPKEEG
jgi:coenzyme F420-reducing hydrogenase gamma subunit